MISAWKRRVRLPIIHRLLPLASQPRTSSPLQIPTRPYWSEWSSSVHWTNWQNYYLGGPLHEEDSPGNYTIREVDGHLEIVTYNDEGAEHIQVTGK